MPSFQFQSIVLDDNNDNQSISKIKNEFNIQNISVWNHPINDDHAAVKDTHIMKQTMKQTMKQSSLVLDQHKEFIYGFDYHQDVAESKEKSFEIENLFLELQIKPNCCEVFDVPNYYFYKKECIVEIQSQKFDQTIENKIITNESMLSENQVDKNQDLSILNNFSEFYNNHNLQNNHKLHNSFRYCSNYDFIYKNTKPIQVTNTPYNTHQVIAQEPTKKFNQSNPNTS